MKISKIFLPGVTILLAAGSLLSCGKKDGADETIEFETRADSVGYLIPDFYGDTVYCAAKYSVVWPSKIGEQDFEALKDSLSMITFGTPGGDFDKISKEFLQSGLKELSSEEETELKYESVPYQTANDDMRTNSEYVSSEVTLLTPELLVIGVTHSSYAAGAAHGMYGTTYLNYSILNHQLLTAEKMFLPGNDKGILSIIASAAAEQYPEEGVLFDAPITSYANFQITENEIIFVYQPYEIGPYSSGVIEIKVSPQDLYRFLTPEAKATLGL